MTAFDPTVHLPDDLLERIRERAPIHDRENTFPQQDLDELRDAGYLRILVPAERGVHEQPVPVLLIEPGRRRALGDVPPHPLRVVGEVADWARLAPEALQAWRDRLAVILADERGEIIN